MKIKTLKQLGIPDLTREAYQALPLEQQVETYLLIHDEGKTLDSPVSRNTLSYFFRVHEIEELSERDKTYRGMLTYTEIP